MKRILISAGTLVFVGALAVSATGAFFSDTETSTGNTFAAGDIDLQIDNESYILSTSTPQVMIPWPATSWILTDLTIEKFFDFIDMKPGDFGEDTISIHVGSNDAWLCAAAQTYDDLDNTIVEPEDEEFGTNSDNDDGTLDGDLDAEVNFAFWVDDGDNVYEPFAGNSGSPESIFLSGSIADLNGAGQIALADDAGGVLGAGNPIPGGSTFFIGKAWCFGTMTEDDLVQDGSGNLIDPTTAQGTGFLCDGSSVRNLSQTDSVKADLEFYAEQSRNNATFLCSTWNPSWTPAPTTP